MSKCKCQCHKPVDEYYSKFTDKQTTWLFKQGYRWAPKDVGFQSTYVKDEPKLKFTQGVWVNPSPDALFPVLSTVENFTTMVNWYTDELTVLLND